MKRIVVKAKGSMCFRPDWIEIIIKISAADTSHKDAMKRLYEKSEELMECLNGLGLDNKDIDMISMTTDIINDLNLDIDAENYENNGIKITQKYKVGVPFVISCVADVVDKIMHSGISAEILLVQTVRDRAKIRIKLIKKAIKIAKKKAKCMAKTVGTKLGRVLTIKYNEKCIEDECYISQEFFDSYYFPVTCGSTLGTDFLPNEITLTDEVEIEWKLKKR